MAKGKGEYSPVNEGCKGKAVRLCVAEDERATL